MRVALALVLLTSAVHADVDKQVIGRVVKRQLMTIADCFQKAGRFDRVNVDFVIGKTGRVTLAVASGGGGNKALQSCVAGVFQRMKFPASPGVTKVSYPVQICVAGQ